MEITKAEMMKQIKAKKYYHCKKCGEELFWSEGKLICLNDDYEITIKESD